MIICIRIRIIVEMIFCLPAAISMLHLSDAISILQLSQHPAALRRTSIDAPSLLHHLQDTDVIAELLRHISHELQILRIVGNP